MYTNFTFTADGELIGKMGIQTGAIEGELNLNTYSDFDNIRITAAQQKLQYLLDLVTPDKILISDFSPTETGLISKLSYSSNGTIGLVSKKASTAVARREDNSVRFQDSIDGHIAILHGMLRLLFATVTPNDIILGHAHNIFTTLLYSMIIGSLSKNYTIVELPEQNLAAIRYGCACISAKKHFELNFNINDVAIPITTMMFERVPPSFYQTDNNIITYAALAEYIKEKAKIIDLDKMTFINNVMMRLGQRALIILECGVDMVIDCLLSKSTSRILSKNLYKMLGQNYEKLHRNVSQSFYQQVSLNIGR